MKQQTKDQYWHDGGVYGRVARTALRTLQFGFAAVVAGLYGVDLAAASKNSSTADSSWVYAEVVAALAMLTCTVHCFVTVKHVLWWIWDWVLFILWIALFGRFATLFLTCNVNNANTPQLVAATTSISRMKVAIWIDLVNMLLWFTTLCHGIAYCCSARRITRRTDKDAPVLNLKQHDLEDGENLPDDQTTLRADTIDKGKDSTSIDYDLINLPNTIEGTRSEPPAYNAISPPHGEQNRDSQDDATDVEDEIALRKGGWGG